MADDRMYGFLEPRDDVRDMRRWIAGKKQRLEIDWCAGYGRGDKRAVLLGQFTYLFDASAGRLIAAYGIVNERNDDDRGSRLDGHPESMVASDVKGHAISHRMGGGFDINIFKQDRALNNGAFKRLEGRAVKFAPSFYFVRLVYGGPSDRPDRIEQGLVSNDMRPLDKGGEPSRLKVQRFRNGIVG